MWEIIGQALGIIATIITLLSFQTNTKKRFLLILSFATLTSALSYLCLGAFAGFAVNAVALGRNICLGVQKSATLPSYLCAVLFAVLMCIAGAFSWQGPISLLVILPMALSTVMMSFGKPDILRKTALVASPAILLYNIFVFSIGGIINEILAVSSAVIGIVRFKKAKSE